MFAEFPPVEYSLRSDEIDAIYTFANKLANKAAFEMIAVAYNYGFQRGQNAERNRRKRERKKLIT